MISIIAALNEKYVIGINNELPWDIPEDMQNFRRLTKDSTVIMGKNTYESILSYRNQPLPNRNNIVVSRTLQDDRVDVCSSLEEAIKVAEKYQKPIWLIGGQRIYQEGLQVADEMWLSHVHNKVDGDAYFPKFNMDEWDIVSKQPYEQFTLIHYRRKQ